MSGKKSGSFDEKGIESLAQDKPVVYDIQDDEGNTLYIGSAKRGRVEQRLKEHLPGGLDPIRGGTKVKIQQKSSITEAEEAETRAIERKQPTQNKKCK
jgi:hypothetical protein